MKILKWILISHCVGATAFAQDAQLWKQYYDSTQVYWARDWGRTVALLEQAERAAINDLGVYDANYLTILNDLGTAYWKTREHAKAEEALARSLALKSEVYPPGDKELLLSISNLAGFYAEQGRWKESKSLYNRILSGEPARIPYDIYVDAAQNLLSLFDHNEQPDSAEYLLRRIEEAGVVQPNSLFFFQQKFYRARIHRKLQQYAVAEGGLHALVKGLAGQKDAGFLELYVQALQEQGILYLQTGAYSRAEKKLLEAYGFVTSDMNREYLLTELSNNLAQVYDKLHIYDKALLYYRESLGRCRMSYDENSLPCAILQNNIAGVHLKQNDIAQAITDYEKVLAVFKHVLAPSDPLYITALNNLATAYRKNNQFEKALASLSRARDLLKQNGFTSDDLFAAVLNNTAVLHTALGDIEQAARDYKTALDIKTAIYGEQSIVLMDLVNNLAVTYWALDRPKEAIPLFKKGMSLATRQVVYVFPNLSESEQVQFYQKLKEDFERFNTIAIQWVDRDPALLAEVFHNRLVIKSLQFFTYQRRKDHIRSKNDPALNQLVSHLKESRDRLGHLYQLPLNQLRNVAEISSLEKEIDSIEKTLNLQSSEGHDAEATARDLKWEDFASRLQPHEAIVEMVRFRKYDRVASGGKNYFGFTDSVYYAGLVLTEETKTRPALVLFPDGHNLETRYYNYYKNAIRYGVEDRLSYHFFWAPLEKALAGKTRIYFSADGIYHKLNINTFRDPRSDKFLLEERQVVNLLNPVQILENNTPLVRKKREAVLMGDPVFDVDVASPRERTVTYNHFGGLPGTQEELRAIDDLLSSRSWKTALYLKGAATEANLKSVTSPTILHIASHGFFSDEVVSLNREARKDFLFHSGLVLTGANKSLANASTSFDNDGIVTAYEVMSLDLSQTDLVVLSACETGLGKVENGEGVFGLQRSFMQAGANNVLISLWKVDDGATRDLMIRFYEYVANGHSYSDSLKRAQTDQAQLLSDPALWGGFVLVGNN